jgi:hypothetical protein
MCIYFTPYTIGTCLAKLHDRWRVGARERNLNAQKLIPAVRVPCGTAKVWYPNIFRVDRRYPAWWQCAGGWLQDLVAEVPAPLVCDRSRHVKSSLSTLEVKTFNPYDVAAHRRMYPIACITSRKYSATS